VRRLTIAHVDTERGFLGGEAQVFLLMEGLAKSGHRNVLIAPPGSRAEAEATRRGIDCVAIPMRNELDLPAIARLTRAFREKAVDLVHLHTGRANWLGGIAAKRAGRPAVTTRRMDRRVGRGWRTRLLYGSLVESVVAISPAVRDCLVDGGVPGDKIRLVYDAVDPEAQHPRVSRESVRAALGTPASGLVVLTLAALIPRKGIDVLLEAGGILERESELRPEYWIAGDGPERPVLEAWAAEAGLGSRARFLGERSDGPDLLGACDVFVLASRREGMGVAALEAMAASRPVVCSAVGGLLTAVVPERTGLHFPAGDAHALAAALERLLDDRELRLRLGQAGPTRIAEGFLASQMAEAYERVYAEALAGAEATQH